jgi:hypothetical protein
MNIETVNDAFLVTVAVGVLLPAVVAFVTNRFASSQFKSVVLLALTAIASILNPLLGSNDVEWKNVLTTFFITFGSAVLSYYGALKPLGIGGTDGKIQTAVPGGLGKAPEEVIPEEDISDLEEADLPGYDEVLPEDEEVVEGTS